jgi:preprotein translocase subunit SecD
MKLTWRIWLMIAFLVGSFFFMVNIEGLTNSGVVVTSIDINSSEGNSGLSTGDIITAVNSKKVSSLEDYSNEITKLFEASSEEKKVVLDTTTGQYIFFTDKIPEITVKEISKTNIQAGLDLQGGARALVRPEKQLSSDEMDDLISITTERLNVFGISDVSVKPVRDLQGNTFMLIEIAGATPRDIESLISQQGKFEARIGEKTVFTGGTSDITYVCRNDANCAGISFCQPSTTNEWFCNYEFVINLNEEASKRHADITRDLTLDPSNPGYLSEQIEFYVDDEFTTSLFISENLQGLETTQIQISGSGQGPDRAAAIQDAEDSMKQMQTILITGSLPFKLEIEKLDTISPLLGKRFTNLIIITAIVALISVSIIVFFRYKNFKASIALLFTSFSEIVILLGVASLIKWNLDLPSIVGILVMIGTGVDQQIVILDESLAKREGSIKQKLRWGMYIVMAAYFTTFFSLLPLFWAGAGLLKGFAVTTLIGLTIGVFITRPAFADMLKILDRNN